MAKSEMAESEMAESEMAEAVRAEAAVARWWALRCPPMCLCKQGPTSSQYVSTCNGGQGKCGRAESPYTIELVESKIPAHLGIRAGDSPALHHSTTTPDKQATA